MPLFGNTFSPKKIPPRKSASLSSLHTLDRSTREIEVGLEYGRYGVVWREDLQPKRLQFKLIVCMEDLKRSLKMPLFGNTFSPKKIPPRKSASLSSLHTLDRSTREIEVGLEYGAPSMNLGGQTWKFEEGNWISESGGHASGREVQRLKKRNVQLEEENNLLKLKIEILLDMLTETTADYHLIEKEVEDIKTQHRWKK